MKQYFQHELNYLRQQGQAFSRANPATAPGLGELSVDPDVERLLEGVAFLTAQIQQQSDAWLPELAHDLLDVVAPELHDGTPSQTIVQIDVDRRRLREMLFVDCGLTLDIAAAKGELCRFRTTQPCTLSSALRLVTTLQRRGQKTHTLSIQIDVYGPRGAASLPGTRSRVFVSGEYADASSLWLAIVKHTKSAKLCVDGEVYELDPQRHLLQIACDAPCSQNDGSQGAKDCVARMRTYFSLPQTCLFFDILWPKSPLQNSAASSFTIELTIDEAHNLDDAVAADALKLGCVPAVNLFKVNAIPVRWQPFVGPQLLRAEFAGIKQVQIYRVDAVEGICNKSFAKIAYRPYRDCNLGRGPNEAAYYHIQKRPSSTQTTHDTFISVHTPEDHTPQLQAQTLSVKLTCTNGSAAVGIGAQSPCRMLGADSSPSAKTVCSASKPLGAPGLQADTWLLLGHMASLRPGTDVRAYLQQLLHLLSRAFDPHSAQGRAHARRIEGIQSVKSKAGYQMYRGLATSCETITMQLNSDCFVSLGDAYIFADIIDAMLADARGINQPHILQVIMMPSEQIYCWPSRGLDF